MFERHALTICTIRGIPIRLHVSLLILLPYVVFVEATQFVHIARTLGVPSGASSLSPLAWGLVLAIAIFACIVIHEMAHALVALRSGVTVRSITLMALGGVTQVDHDVPPSREALMAAVGPITSLVLAVLFYAAHRLVPFGSPLSIGLMLLAEINAVLGIFNLLPAFPMDGGRVLRGLLASKMGLVRATHTAAGIGRAMAVFFGIWGIFSFNFILVLIALFVYAGASAEEDRLRARGILRGFPASRLMTDRLGEARASEPAFEVARRLLENHLVAARVVDGTNGATWPGAPTPTGRTIGIITAWDFVRARGAAATEVTAGELMRGDLPTVHATDDAAPALEAVATGRASAVVVLDHEDRVIGLVTPIEVELALALARAEALHARARENPPVPPGIDAPGHHRVT